MVIWTEIWRSIQHFQLSVPCFLNHSWKRPLPRLSQVNHTLTNTNLIPLLYCLVLTQACTNTCLCKSFWKGKKVDMDKLTSLQLHSHIHVYIYSRYSLRLDHIRHPYCSRSRSVHQLSFLGPTVYPLILPSQFVLYQSHSHHVSMHLTHQFATVKNTSTISDFKLLFNSCILLLTKLLLW